MAELLTRPAAGTTTPTPPPHGLSRGQMLALQRTVGNRAVTSVMRSVAQRVAIKEPTKTETLYNTPVAGARRRPTSTR